MEFRWLVLIALWTMLSGPIFSTPPPSNPQPSAPVAAEVETGPEATPEK